MSLLGEAAPQLSPYLFMTPQGSVRGLLLCSALLSLHLIISRLAHHGIVRSTILWTSQNPLKKALLKPYL